MREGGRTATLRDGTRFLLYPQYDEGFAPEVVTVSAPAGSIAPGPNDTAMYVADATEKRAPYDPPSLLPPYLGRTYAPAEPDALGHFDRIDQDSPQFRAAHLFGMVRNTLDIWERASGEVVHWWHPDAPARLELVPVVHWHNAQSGPGFLETGVWQAADGVGDQLFCFNHDVVAHEAGHAILFGALGIAAADELTKWFFGLHESFADLNAIVTALHFASVRTRVLTETDGNLYALNLINRLGKTAPHQQLRLACNTTTIAEVEDITVDVAGNWHDPLGLGRNCHALADPLTGAVFDCFVEIYQHFLVARGLIPPGSDARGWTGERATAGLQRVGRRHRIALDSFPEAFDDAICDARDTIHRCLIAITRTLPPTRLDFDVVSACILESLLAQGFQQQFGRLAACFTRRGMDPLVHMRLRPSIRHGLVRRAVRMVVPVASPWTRHGGCSCHLSHVAGGRRFMSHPHRGTRHENVA